jgi:3-oxoacyl-[acyl-carrier-protein] synthase II
MANDVDVVVTGVAAITAGGADIDGLWASMVGGKGLAATFETDNNGRWPIDMACHVPGFAPSDWMPRAFSRRASRAQQFVIAASRQLARQGLFDGLVAERTGVSIGTCFGGMELALRQLTRIDRRGWRGIDPFFAAGCMPNTIPGFVAIEYGFRGPNMCPSIACASGAGAVADAAEQIRLGRADAMVAGGVDAPILELVLASYQRVGVLSQRTDDPATAARPFDRSRDGFVLGEGVGLLLLESARHAEARGAASLGELAGWAMNADAYNVMTPARYGTGAKQCMALALQHAGVEPDAVSHVNAHGTGTAANDESEAKAIRSLFGSVPVTANKSVIGHCMGAGGAVEAIVTLLSLRRGLVPPTASTLDVPEEFELDLVTDSPRPTTKAYGVSSSFALGGQNVSLVLRGDCEELDESETETERMPVERRNP